MPALQLVAIRQFLGGIIYISFFLFKKTPWPKGKQWKTIAILSILNFVLSNALSTWGVKYISSGLGAIIGACVPLWIVIISFFQGERLSKFSILGLLISFSGVCVIFYDHLADFFKFLISALGSSFRLFQPSLGPLALCTPNKKPPVLILILVWAFKCFCPAFYFLPTTEPPEPL